jgi:hypothetical protein
MIELFIPKLHLVEKDLKYMDLDGAVNDHDARRLNDSSWKRQASDYYRTYPRIAIYNTGNHVMLTEGNKVEWAFSPKFGWNDMPSEVIEKIKSYNCMWDDYGKFVEHENNAEPECGYRKNFFIMKSERKWMFKMKKFYIFGHDYWEAYKPPISRERFHIFQNFKIMAQKKTFG